LICENCDSVTELTGNNLISYFSKQAEKNNFSYKKHNLEILGKIISWATCGVDPSMMGLGPIPSSNKALEIAKWNVKDLDLVEINEAFAAQVLACTRELGIQDDDPKINPNGGAIAYGHPLGMSGTRLVLSASKQLELNNLKYALCTMCVGVGQGSAVILEKV